MPKSDSTGRPTRDESSFRLLLLLVLLLSLLCALTVWHLRPLALPKVLLHDLQQYSFFSPPLAPELEAEPLLLARFSLGDLAALAAGSSSCSFVSRWVSLQFGQLIFTPLRIYTSKRASEHDRAAYIMRSFGCGSPAREDMLRRLVVQEGMDTLQTENSA